MANRLQAQAAQAVLAVHGQPRVHASELKIRGPHLGRAAGRNSSGEGRIEGWGRERASAIDPRNEGGPLARPSKWEDVLYFTGGWLH